MKDFVRTRTEWIDCDCQVVRPHGTPHTYQYHRCGCTPCRIAHREYLDELEARRARGESAYVPSAPVADRIRLLQRRGLSIQYLSALLGYHQSTLYRIASGARNTRWCRREIHQDIMSIPVPTRRKNAS